MSSLNIDNLTYRYNGKPVIESLSLHIQHDEIVCLLGASGCGKTTTLKAIAGLIQPAAGEIHIAGALVNSNNLFVAPQQRNIGMMFQDYALFPHLTVAQNIGFGLSKLTKAARNERVGEMLALIQLTDYAERYPHQLSGGQQQRVAIARALAYKPSLLLLDEPFSNIDHQVRFHLIEDIRRIIKEQGVSAIFVTHSKEEAYAFADKLAIMHQGKIAQIGTPEELYNDPAEKVVAEFLSPGVFLKAHTEDGIHFTTELGSIKSTAITGSTTPLATGSGDIYLKPHYVDLSANECGDGRFVSRRFVGSHYLYRIKLAGQEIEVPIKQDLALTSGQQVSISVSAHRVNFFTS